MRACFCFLFVFATLVSCRNPSIPDTGDASVIMLEPGEAHMLAETFLAARAVQGTEACRCAGDVPFCRSETDPALTTEQRACLESRIETGGAAFRNVIPCLAAAADAYASCGTPFSCPEVEARNACKNAYSVDGAACFHGDGALAGLLSACLPESNP